MGNKVEQWMLEIQEKNIKNKPVDNLKFNDLTNIVFKAKNPNKLFFLIKQRIVIKFFNVFYSYRIDLNDE